MSDPRRGRTKQRGKNSRRLAAAVRVTVSPPAAPGSQENRQAEAEASPEGEVSNHKRQPADRSECRAGGPGSRPTVSGAQWRDPRTSLDPQLQRGQPGKKEPAAAGRKEEPPTEALTSTGRSKGKVPMTTPDPEPGSWRQHVTPTWDSEEHWRELSTTEAHGHSEDHLATHPEGQGAQRRRRQRCEVHPGD